MKYFYENNPAIDSEFNITFEEVLLMSPKEFEIWILKVRDYIKLIWDSRGVPPIIGGSTEKEIIESFKNLQTFMTDDFLVLDEEDNTRTVIRNWDRTASAVNQFFPAMMKTRIAVGPTDSGKSIYDWTADKSLERRFINTMISKFKKDAMYYFGRNVLVDDPEYRFTNAKTGREWIEQYQTNLLGGADDFRRQYDFWIKESDKDRNPKEDKPYLLLTINDIHDLKAHNKLTRVNMANLLDNLTPYYKSGKPKYYSIVAFKRGQRVMRQIIQVFRIGFSIQPAVNFPPLTAKFLYECYTRHIPDENIIVYDPSAGWGGRILGAMAFDKKNVHYVGTDPNTENFISDLGITRYEYLADFFNKNINRFAGKFWGHQNTYEVFMEGSEHISKNPEFQKYKEKLDFVFTSPPYFNREKYSDDDTQSYKAYSEYNDWRENFLRPTLTTAYEYLKPNRYICWNIADIKVVKDKYIPLEQDSIDILKELGAEYVTKLKMIVVTMIGLDASKLKNKCKVDGRWQKYEPVYVFRKT